MDDLTERVAQAMYERFHSTSARRGPWPMVNGAVVFLNEDDWRELARMAVDLAQALAPPPPDDPRVTDPAVGMAAMEKRQSRDRRAVETSKRRIDPVNELIDELRQRIGAVGAALTDATKMS